MASILARVKSQRLCLWTKTPSSTSLMTFQVIIEQLEIQGERGEDHKVVVSEWLGVFVISAYTRAPCPPDPDLVKSGQGPRILTFHRFPLGDSEAGDHGLKVKKPSLTGYFKPQLLILGFHVPWNLRLQEKVTNGVSCCYESVRAIDDFILRLFPPRPVSFVSQSLSLPLLHASAPSASSVDGSCVPPKTSSLRPCLSLPEGVIWLLECSQPVLELTRRIPGSEFLGDDKWEVVDKHPSILAS